MLKPDQPERDELFHRILKVLNEMPDSMRQAFMLSHYNGLSLDQIARKIGVEQQDASSLLKRANTLFHEKLEPLIPPKGPHAPATPFQREPHTSPTTTSSVMGKTKRLCGST